MYNTIKNNLETNINFRYLSIIFFLFIYIQNIVCQSDNHFSKKTYREIDTLITSSVKSMDSDPEKALKLAKKAYQKAQEKNYAEGKAGALKQIGLAYNYKGQYIEAIQYIESALKIQRKQNDPKKLADIIAILGLAYENKGSIDKALYYYLESLTLYQKIHFNKGISNALLNVGCVFLKQKKYNDALIYFEKTMIISSKNNYKYTIAAASNNIGIIYDVKNQKKKALEYYNRALRIQEELDNKREVAHLYNNIAIVYNDLKNYTKSLESHQKSLYIKEKLGDKEGIANSFFHLAEVYKNIGNLKYAEIWCQKSLGISRKYHFFMQLKQAYGLMSDIYQSQKKYPQALETYKLFKQYNDSLYDEEMGKQITEMQAKYESKQKNQENIILRQKINIQQTKVSQQQQYTHFLIALAIAAISLSVLLYLLFRNKSVSLRNTRLLYENQLHLQEIANLEREKLKTQVDLKNHELSSLTLHSISKNEILGKIKKALMEQRLQKPENYEKVISELISLINSNLDTDIDWKKFRLNFDVVHPGFFDHLTEKFPDLTLNEHKLCAYLLINLSSKEISQIMNLSLAAINKNRQRLRKRLSLELESDLGDFLKSI